MPLMPWLLLLPGHQQPWYWLWRINMTNSAWSAMTSPISGRSMWISMAWLSTNFPNNVPNKAPLFRRLLHWFIDNFGDLKLGRKVSEDDCDHECILLQAVDGLLDGLTAMPATDAELMFRFRDCHLLVLRGLQDHRAYGPQWTNKQVTRLVRWPPDVVRLEEDLSLA